MTTTSSDTPPYPEMGTGPEQRVWALFRAKRVLDVRAPFGKGEISTVDLIDISQYILTGEDPYVVAREAATT